VLETLGLMQIEVILSPVAAAKANFAAPKAAP
jgi:hypothetical protein